MVHTSFFDFEVGNKIVIKANNISYMFLPELIYEIQKNGLTSFLMYTEDKDYYPCSALKLNLEDEKLLFQKLTAYIDGGDVLIVDHLKTDTDFENTFRLISEMSDLKDKTIIIFCEVDHLPTRPNEFMNTHFTPTEKQLVDERIFNDNCLKYGFTKVFEFYVIAHLGAKVTYLLNSFDKTSKKKLSFRQFLDIVNRRC